MCGISGILNLTGDGVDGELLERMIERVRHRGPDEQGLHVKGPVGLAHARLSILDLENGQQPMVGPDGSTWVTFNGEIFNFIELRAELEALGHRFRTRSDTEVLLHAYLAWGEDCVEHLNGQWAFAIWDARKGQLFASRDRMGIRPFYFTTQRNRLLFASEIKCLLADPSVPRAVDLRALDQIFTGWVVQPPRTFFKGINQLPPGHNLRARAGQLTVYPYFDLSYDPVDSETRVDALAEELRELLADATRIRLRADVPVGAYLSGGLDSSILTGLVQREAKERLRTFSVTFEDPEFDESKWQREVIDYLGVDHEQTLVTARDIGAKLPAVAWHSEQAIPRTAPTPLYLLSALVRERGYKVVLTGEGADELFGGYDIFREALVRRAAAEDPNLDRASLLRQLYTYQPALQAQSDAYLKAFFRADPADLADPFFSHQPRWGMTSRLKTFFSDDVRSALEGYDAREEFAAALPRAYHSWEPLAQAQYLETRQLMSGYILSSQGDRVMMANAVEGRFPFLDHRVVAFASRLPARMKLKSMNEKYLLKRAAGDLVPDFLRRRPKQPYRAPDAECFFDPTSGAATHDYIDELLSESALEQSGLFHPKAVGLLVKKAKKGRVRGVRDGMALTALLTTQLVVHQLIADRGRISIGD